MTKYISKIFYVLTGSRKKLKLFLLFILFSFSSLLEAFGIGLIGPFLSMASNPSSIHEYAILDWTYQKLNLQSSGEFIPVLGLGIAILFCFKSCLFLSSQFFIYKFTFNQQSLLRSRLLRTYLHAPYHFHLNRNTSSIIRNSVIEARKFINLTLLPLLETTANLILILCLLVLLAKTDAFLLVLIMLVLMPTFVLFYRLRNKISNWGKKVSLSEQGMIRVINHGLGSIKETRIIGCESFFIKQMDRESKRYEKSSLMFNISQRSPRILIETILLIFILLFVSVSQIYSEQNMQEIISALAVFSVASIRLIPASNMIITSMGKMQNSSFALDVLFLDLKELSTYKSKIFVTAKENNSIDRYRGNHRNLTFTSHIELHNLTYSYPGASNNSLQNISLRIEKGQSIAFIGKSGAGKTTLVDVVLGLLEPQEGDISVDGKSIYNNLRSWRNIIGYIPQSIFLLDDTIENNIVFGVPEHMVDQKRLSTAIKAAELEEFVNQCPQGIKTNVGERGVRLSGGQRQRIGIARALYDHREILVLDEATSALDNETEKMVSEAIRALAGTKTLIMIAHRMSTVKDCDRIYLLEKGSIVKSGSYDEVVLKEAFT